MISVEEALETIAQYANTLGAITLPVKDTFGYVPAEDIFSGSDIPALDNSAMDGYAVRVEDLHLRSGFDALGSA